MQASAEYILTEEITYANELESALLRAILYFDVFNYPLSLEEINDNCNHLISANHNTKALLNELKIVGLIKEKDGFYFVNESNSIVEKRKEGNKRAERFYKIAFWYSRLISWFPFVRGIYLSGSLSKGYMDKDSDIDYFIITSPSRLWLCRTLLILFKKVFLLNSRKYFCVNYFVDTNNIEIPDRNIFTATELVFIHPTYNYELYRQCMKSNSWIKEYYPNKKFKSDVNVLPEKKYFVKHLFEKFLDGRIGEKLDEWCFKITLNHRQRKFKDFDKSQFDLHLRSKKEVSKHHPSGFQLKVLDSYNQKIKDFETKHNIILNKTDE